MVTRLSAFAAVALALCLGLGAAATGAGARPATTVAAAQVLQRQVLVELNVVRRAHGLPPLRGSSPLSAAAGAHSRAMATHGFFAHESLDGSAFWRRVKRYYAPGPSGGWSVGENLLWSTPGIGAAEAVKLWMESPGHRRNILTARWREIGISAVTASAAPGVYGGRDVVIVTTDFGARS